MRSGPRSRRGLRQARGKLRGSRVPVKRSGQLRWTPSFVLELLVALNGVSDLARPIGTLRTVFHVKQHRTGYGLPTGSARMRFNGGQRGETGPSWLAAERRATDSSGGTVRFHVKRGSPAVRHSTRRWPGAAVRSARARRSPVVVAHMCATVTVTRQRSAERRAIASSGGTVLFHVKRGRVTLSHSTRS
jgi:hypothetical protein